MEPDRASFPDVRPKRQSRRPSRFDDFEVEYTHHSIREMPHWEIPPPIPRHVEHQPQYSTAPPRYGDSDVTCSPTSPQLERSEQGRNFRDLTPEVFPYNLLETPIQPSHTGFRALQVEREKLLQSQEVLQEGLRELNEARSDIKALIEVAHSLRKDMAQLTASKYPIYQPPMSSSERVYTTNTRPIKDEDEEEWPDPPPWPEPGEELHTGFSKLKVEEQYSDYGLQYYPPPNTASLPRKSFLPTRIPQEHRGNVFHASSQHVEPSSKWASINAGLLQPNPVQVEPHTSVTGAACEMSNWHNSAPPLSSEAVYRGPKPTIPKFLHSDPTEFARLRMALENLLPRNATELFKYQILVDHLKFDEARLIADAYLNSPKPYTDTMAALHDKFGQPHQLALRKIASVLDGPEIRRGDIVAFQRFSLQVQSLVGLLQTLGLEGEVELNCGSHVARLISKLPPEQRADFRRHQFKQPGTTYTLHDLSEWLRQESWCQGFDSQAGGTGSRERTCRKADAHPFKQTVTVLHNVKGPSEHTSLLPKESRVRGKNKPIVLTARAQNIISVNVMVWLSSPKKK
ncbi:uncharacterized protein LOC116729480 [Xiphophorus hellerii]|uniref:uncharacterized protein LOC116729480 n=1 Tax=Xiphophorus hellerii TaxID=8084 RepID=UPI0013B455C2|nr:uncharacterized protein LOC116729480 [Xiphophorus hellerii]